MHTLLRWGYKGLAGLLAILLIETGIWGIPDAIASQVAFLAMLNEYGIVRLLVALALAVLLAGAALGPTRLQEWRKSASEWLHASTRQIEQLQAELEEVKGERDALKNTLSTYEDRDTTKVVASAENGGPVVLDVARENRGPSYCRGIRHEGGGESVGGTSYDTFLVPYKPHNSVIIALDEPAAIVEVGGLDDIFLVAFSYQARSTEKHSSEWRPQPQVAIWLQVLDDDKCVVRDLNIHTGLGTMIESERWWEHTVSSSYILSGLSKGVYGLNVYEEMARSMGAREYLNMRLTVKNV